MFTKEELTVIINVLAQTQIQVMQAQQLLIIIAKCQEMIKKEEMVPVVPIESAITE